MVNGRQRYQSKMAANSVMSGTASATFGVSISEKWIRERLNLQKDSLDDVRSLSLPGSYCEKITHLGRSLMGFTRLKHLDLSRNAIESLEGLQDLKHLETLNLYYNNVPSLNEIFKLGHNSKLKDLDLRLNPVTKNEPDYRLFVVHMLVNLRKLDDRSVRDSERKAALMHFDTGQANEFDEHFQRQPAPEHGGVLSQQTHKHVSARTALVRSLAPRPTALDEDTDYLLDLISKSDHLLSPRRGHLSPSHIPASQSLESSPGRQYQRQQPRPHRREQQPSSRGDRVTPSRGHVTPSRSHMTLQQQQRRFRQQQRQPAQHFSPSRELDVSDDDGGRGHYSSRSKPAFALREDFSPSPVDEEEGIPQNSSHLALRQLLVLIQGHVDGDLMNLEGDSQFRDKFRGWYGSLHLRVPRSPSLEWAGQMESLQGEVGALQTELRSMEGHLREKDRGCEAKDNRIRELEELLNHVKAESAELGRQLQSQVTRTEELGRSRVTLEDSQKALQQAKMDMSRLQQKMQALQEENRALREAFKHGPSVTQLEKAHKQIGELQAENCAIKREMETNLDRHKQDLVNTAQLQELATMLQEGHRSLVATNDHLLQELEEARLRHSQEVMQMNNNYEQLRKTVQLYS